MRSPEPGERLAAIRRDLAHDGYYCRSDAEYLLNEIDSLKYRLGEAALTETKDDAPGHCENCRAAVPLTTVHLCAICLPAAPAPQEPDEEMALHSFDARTANDDEIWCTGCEYHRDHEIHLRFAGFREGQEHPPARASLPLRAGEPQ